MALDVEPWGFGINFQEIQNHVRNIVIVSTGLARDKVFILDQGARNPQQARPWIGITTSTAGNAIPVTADSFIFGALEQWLIAVTVPADDTYTLTILSIDYTFVASGATITEIRDGLLTAIGTQVEFSASAVSTGAIQIASLVAGQQLIVKSVPASLVVLQIVKNAIKRDLYPAEIQVNIECHGALSIESPNADQTGASLAHVCQTALSSIELTEAMRQRGHTPSVVRLLDLPAVVNEQVEAISTCQVIMRTTSRLDVAVQSARTTTISPTVFVGGIPAVP